MADIDVGDEEEVVPHILLHRYVLYLVNVFIYTAAIAAI